MRGRREKAVGGREGEKGKMERERERKGCSV